MNSRTDWRIIGSKCKIVLKGEFIKSSDESRANLSFFNLISFNIPLISLISFNIPLISLISYRFCLLLADYKFSRISCFFSFFVFSIFPSFFSYSFSPSHDLLFALYLRTVIMIMSCFCFWSLDIRWICSGHVLVSSTTRFFWGKGTWRQRHFVVDTDAVFTDCFPCPGPVFTSCFPLSYFIAL